MPPFFLQIFIQLLYNKCRKNFGGERSFYNDKKIFCGRIGDFVHDEFYDNGGGYYGKT